MIDNGKQPIPLHTLVHAWGYLTYDSDRKKFAFVSWSAGPIPRYFLGGEKQMDEGLKLLEEQMKGKKKSVFSPWFYDVASGKFERSPTNEPDGHQRRWVSPIPLPPFQEAILRRGFRHRGDFRPRQEPVDRCQAERPSPQGLRWLRLLRFQAEPDLSKRR